jgi:hypothetical protein
LYRERNDDDLLGAVVFNKQPALQALWQLSLVLREIARGSEQPGTSEVESEEEIKTLERHTTHDAARAEEEKGWQG